MSDSIRTQAIREAIDHARKVALSCGEESPCGVEHGLLAGWLERLLEVEAALAREKRAVEALVGAGAPDDCDRCPAEMCCGSGRVSAAQCRAERRKWAYSEADRPLVPDNKKELTAGSDGGTVGAGGRE